MLHTPGARLQTGPDASRGRQPLIGCCCARARRRRWWAPRFGSAGRAAAAPPTAAAASAATPGPAPALATSSPAHLNERKLLGQLPLPLRFLTTCTRKFLVHVVYMSSWTFNSLLLSPFFAFSPASTWRSNGSRKKFMLLKNASYWFLPFSQSQIMAPSDGCQAPSCSCAGPQAHTCRKMRV